MSQQAAKRRRAQAKNGFRHIDKMRRPIYSKISKEKSSRRLARLIAGERARQGRKSSKK